jgi:hypothetical protein
MEEGAEEDGGARYIGTCGPDLLLLYSYSIKPNKSNQIKSNQTLALRCVALRWDLGRREELKAFLIELSKISQNTILYIRASSKS